MGSVLARSRDRGLVDEHENKVRGDERERVDVPQEKDGGAEADWHDEEAGAEERHSLLDERAPVSREAAGREYLRTEK